MPRINRSSLVVLLVGLGAGSAGAQEPIRFARTPDISPDGKLVAFSYLGDIWVVETIGGIARPVTMHEAHDINPVFSPDGQLDRLHLQPPRQLRRVRRPRPAAAGRRRLTFDSADRHGHAAGRPTARTSCSPPPAAPSLPAELRAVHRARSRAGRARRVTAAEGKEGVFSPKGDRIAYVRGPGHVVPQGLPRLVQRRHLDLQRRRHQQPPADHLQRPGQLAHVERPTARRSTTSASTTARRPTSSAWPLDSRRRGPTGTRRSWSPTTRTTASAGPASAATASGSSTSAAPTCGSSPRKDGSRRASWPSRSTPTTRPTPSGSITFTSGRHRVRPRRPTRSTSPSSSTARCSCMPSRRRQGDAADRRPGLRPRHRLGARRHEDPLPLRPQRPRGPLPARSRRPRAPRSSPRRTRFKVKQLTNTPRGRVGVSFRPTASGSPSCGPASCGR